MLNSSNALTVVLFGVVPLSSIAVLFSSRLVRIASADNIRVQYTVYVQYVTISRTVCNFTVLYAV